MKRVHKNDLVFLGCDYVRNNDYYFHPKTGKLYKRHSEFTSIRGRGKVDTVEEIFHEMNEGKAVYAEGFGPVLTRDN